MFISKVRRVFDAWPLLLGLVVVIGLGLYHNRIVHAQQNGAVRVQHDATMLQACTPFNSNAAVNTAFTTITLTPPAGQFVYICGADFTVSFDATGGTVSTNVTLTSANLGGWLYKYSSPGTASTNVVQLFQFSQPMKSVNPGTAVQFISPTGNLHGAYNLNVYYYFAP